MAIEIEASGSRKHLLGDVANASIIGAIGIIIPFDEDKLNQFIKLGNYLDFATKVGKIRAVFNNVLVVERNQFIQLVSQYDVRHENPI
jgi:hypothetical protein